MSYVLGSEFKAGQDVTGAVVTLDTKNVYQGFRAFTKNEMTGTYFEVFETYQERLFVDNTNQGAWRQSTFETREDAFNAASAMYHKINK